MRSGLGRRASPAALAYAAYADLLWCETGTPDLEFARTFAEAVHRGVPGQDAGLQLLAVVQLEAATSTTPTIARFQKELGAMGYKFQFVTLAGFHALNHSMFELARGYAADGHDRLRASCRRREFAAEADGYTATKHQARSAPATSTPSRTALNPDSSTTALSGSTEAEQF